MRRKNLFIGGGVVSVIILGIFTNALWDLIKPFTVFLFKIALNLSILGIDSFKNGIYEEIARGLHEYTSIQLLFIIHSILLALVIGLLFGLLIIRKRILEFEGEEKSNNKNSFLNKFINVYRNIHKRSVFVWFLIFYVVFTGTIFVLDLVRQNYINNAITYFEQLTKIVRPYSTNEQMDLYYSNFSQIHNKNDFVNIINQLEEVVKNNNLKAPEFSFTF